MDFSGRVGDPAFTKAGAAVNMSFIKLHGQTIEPGSIRAQWNGNLGCYVIGLTEDAAMHLSPDIARELVGAVGAAMVERSDITPSDKDGVDHEAVLQDLVTRFKRYARQLEWEGRNEDATRVRYVLGSAGYVAAAVVTSR